MAIEPTLDSGLGAIAVPEVFCSNSFATCFTLAPCPMWNDPRGTGDLRTGVGVMGSVRDAPLLLRTRVTKKGLAAVVMVVGEARPSDERRPSEDWRPSTEEPPLPVLPLPLPVLVLALEPERWLGWVWVGAGELLLLLVLLLLVLLPPSGLHEAGRDSASVDDTA